MIFRALWSQVTFLRPPFSKQLFGFEKWTFLKMSKIKKKISNLGEKV